MVPVLRANCANSSREPSRPCVSQRASAERRAIYLIYANPVQAAQFDASPALTRRWARTVPCASEERGYGPDLEETVVIWQAGNAPPPTESAAGVVVLRNEGSRAELR